MGIRESATASIKSAPADVFRTVTDIKRLAEWNKGIVEVVELPISCKKGRSGRCASAQWASHRW